MLREHRLLRHYVRGADAYRAGTLDAEGLQVNMSALMGALEGDVPADIREAFLFVEGEIDTIRFSMGTTRGRQEILRVLAKVDELIDQASDPSQA